MPQASAAGSIGDGKAGLIERLFANSRDLMLVSDGQGRLRLVNPAWCETVGLPEQALIGRRLLEFVHPDDVQDHHGAWGRRPPGALVERDLRLRLANGDWRWYAARAQRLADGLNIVTLRDATEARAHAEELEEARRARKLLVTAAGVGAWSYEPRERRITLSEELVGVLGGSSARFSTPERFRNSAHPEDYGRVARVLRRGVLEGLPGEVEYRVSAPRGWITLRVTFHAEPRPGGVFALRGIAQDVTELAEARDVARRGEQRMRQARREALANARRLKLALEVAGAGVYEIDHVRKTFWASPEFKRLTGRQRTTYAEAAELKHAQFHPEDRELIGASLGSQRRVGQCAGGACFEARIIDAFGDPRWVRVCHHLQLARDGRVLKAVGLVHDIDASRRQGLALLDAQQAAEAAGEAKAAFLANMSHEIRTPMNGIMGVMHLLKKEPLSDEGRSLLDEALSCGKMLAELLNDIIDFSKIEAGRLELSYEPVDPPALVRGVMRLLQPQADAKSLRLVVEADPQVSWVRTDPIRLRQALFNLAGNAVKFTEQGGVTVRVLRGASPGRLRFEVQDTGVGIPYQVQPRIFDRFDQGDASTTRKFGGSGLGLAITQRLAEMMSGELGFTSAPGEGSTFWLEIAAEPAEPEARPVDQPAGILEGLRVLVVEDNATNRMIASKLLEQLGAAVETAADGYLGIEAAAHGAFDVILMDVQMPGIDGVEAARRIRALGGRPAETPIVALTANVLTHQRQAYLDSGMDGVVGKPISPAALLAEIARLTAPQEPGAAGNAAA